MIHRVRSHATFAALSRVRPRRDGPVWVRQVESGAHRHPEVAYAIGRGSGNAVIRNRLRRRLRAIVHQHEGLLRPGSSYLIGVSKTANVATFHEMEKACANCLEVTRG